MPILPPQALRRASGVAGALACSLIVGCASKPTMHLNHAEISGAQLATFPPTVGILMTIVVDVYNPNGYDVAVRAMRGTVTMADRYLLPLDFRPAEGVWLASGKTTSVRVPVTMPVDLGLLLLREAFNNPTINYRVTGKSDVTASRTFQVEKDDYSVDEQGTISREQIAAIIPASVLAPR